MKVGDKFHGATVVCVDRSRGRFTVDCYTVPRWRPSWRDILRWTLALLVLLCAIRWG